MARHGSAGNLDLSRPMSTWAARRSRVRSSGVEERNRGLARITADYRGMSWIVGLPTGYRTATATGDFPKLAFRSLPCARQEPGGYTPLLSRPTVPNRIFDFPSPPRVRCPRRDDRFAVCGPRDFEFSPVPEPSHSRPALVPAVPK